MLSGSQIIGETVYDVTPTSKTESCTVVYIYDESGSVIGMKYRTPSYSVGAFDYYFFEKNLRGDIVAVYDDAGTKLCTFNYDAWGYSTISYESGVASSTKWFLNDHCVFRYRGYYYDTETGFYYLQSRYYNPAWGRFLNADDCLYNNILGFNLYTYCYNNSVNYIDPYGKNAVEVLDWWQNIAVAIALIEPTIIGEIILIVGGVILAGTIIVNVAESTECDSNEIDLPDESEVEVDVDHVMKYHHPSGGKGPRKDKFPWELTAPTIERMIREAYKNAITNYPDSVMKVQQGIKYYIKGKAEDGQIIYIWINIITKIIETAFPK